MKIILPLFIISFFCGAVHAEIMKLRQETIDDFRHAWGGDKKSFPLTTKNNYPSIEFIDKFSNKPSEYLFTYPHIIYINRSTKPPSLIKQDRLVKDAAPVSWGNLPKGDTHSDLISAHGKIWCFVKKNGRWVLYFSNNAKDYPDWETVSSDFPCDIHSFYLTADGDPAVIGSIPPGKETKKISGEFTGGGSSIQWNSSENITPYEIQKILDQNYKNSPGLMGEFDLKQSGEMLAFAYDIENQHKTTIRYRVSPNPSEPYGAWSSPLKTNVFQLAKEGQFFQYEIQFLHSSDQTNLLPETVLTYRHKKDEVVEKSQEYGGYLGMGDAGGATHNKNDIHSKKAKNRSQPAQKKPSDQTNLNSPSNFSPSSMDDEAPSKSNPASSSNNKSSDGQDSSNQEKQNGKALNNSSSEKNDKSSQKTAVQEESTQQKNPLKQKSQNKQASSSKDSKKKQPSAPSKNKPKDIENRSPKPSKNNSPENQPTSNPNSNPSSKNNTNSPASDDAKKESPGSSPGSSDNNTPKADNSSPSNTSPGSSDQGGKSDSSSPENDDQQDNQSNQQPSNQSKEPSNGEPSVTGESAAQREQASTPQQNSDNTPKGSDSGQFPSSQAPNNNEMGQNNEGEGGKGTETKSSINTKENLVTKNNQENLPFDSKQPGERLKKPGNNQKGEGVSCSPETLKKGDSSGNSGFASGFSPPNNLSGGEWLPIRASQMIGHLSSRHGVSSATRSSSSGTIRLTEGNTYPINSWDFKSYYLLLSLLGFLFLFLKRRRRAKDSEPDTQTIQETDDHNTKPDLSLFEPEKLDFGKPWDSILQFKKHVLTASIGEGKLFALTANNEVWLGIPPLDRHSIDLDSIDGVWDGAWKKIGKLKNGFQDVHFLMAGEQLYVIGKRRWGGIRIFGRPIIENECVDRWEEFSHPKVSNLERSGRLSNRLWIMGKTKNKRVVQFANCTSSGIYAWKKLKQKTIDNGQLITVSSGSDLLYGIRPEHDPDHLWIYSENKQSYRKQECRPLAKVAYQRGDYFLYSKDNNCFLTEIPEGQQQCIFHIFNRDNSGRIVGGHSNAFSIPYKLKPCFSDIVKGRLVLIGEENADEDEPANALLLSAKLIDVLKMKSAA